MNIKPVTILLVEDEYITAKIQTNKLIRFGYNVIIAGKAEEAISLIENRKYKFDLVITDIDLGSGLNGIQVAQIIQSKYKIPVIYLTSNSDSEIMRQAQTISSYGYILKQMGFAVLIEAIELVIGFDNSLFLFDNGLNDFE